MGDGRDRDRDRGRGRGGKGGFRGAFKRRKKKAKIPPNRAKTSFPQNPPQKSIYCENR